MQLQRQENAIGTCVTAIHKLDLCNKSGYIRRIRCVVLPRGEGEVISRDQCSCLQVASSTHRRPGIWLCMAQRTTNLVIGQIVQECEPSILHVFHSKEMECYHSPSARVDSKSIVFETHQPETIQSSHKFRVTHRKPNDVD